MSKNRATILVQTLKKLDLFQGLSSSQILQILEIF